MAAPRACGRKTGVQVPWHWHGKAIKAPSSHICIVPLYASCAKHINTEWIVDTTLWCRNEKRTAETDAK